MWTEPSFSFLWWFSMSNSFYLWKKEINKHLTLPFLRVSLSFQRPVVTDSHVVWRSCVNVRSFKCVKQSPVPAVSRLLAELSPSARLVSAVLRRDVSQTEFSAMKGRKVRYRWRRDGDSGRMNKNVIAFSRTDEALGYGDASWCCCCCLFALAKLQSVLIFHSLSVSPFTSWKYEIEGLSNHLLDVLLFN